MEVEIFMLEMFRMCRKLVMRLILHIFYIFPIDNDKILAVNTLAFNYSDNPKYIFEKLKARKGLKLYFAVNREYREKSIPGPGVHYITYNSLLYFFHIMTCKVFITNSGGFSFAPLRKRQYVINTWHGGGNGKSMGIDGLGDTRLIRMDLELSAKQTSLFLSTNKLASASFKHALLIPAETIYEVGQPRNDMLLAPNAAMAVRIRDAIGLKKDEKMVIFAPTYRVMSNDPFKADMALYDLDYSRLIQALSNKFGGKWRVAVRFHPRVKDRNISLPKEVIDLTMYEDMQEILLVSDVMINDFSSSMWDMMVSKKPCFLYAPDMDEYIQKTGLYYPYEKLPFPKARNNDELEVMIQSFELDQYLEDCRKYYEEVQGCETGMASVLAVEKILQILCAETREKL